MNYKMTHQVKRRQKAMTKTLKVMMITLSVICFLLGIMLTRAFLFPCFISTGFYFGYDILSEKEYEYTLECTMFTIDVIYGRQYRKRMHTLDLKNLEIVAPHWHMLVAPYKKNIGTVTLHKFDYKSYNDDIPYYTMVIMEEHQKIKLLLDLEENMLRVMKRMYPEKVCCA